MLIVNIVAFTVAMMYCKNMQDFPVDNYLCLYDMHEKYLNNLVGRFSEQLITDFFR